MKRVKKYLILAFSCIVSFGCLLLPMNIYAAEINNGILETYIYEDGTKIEILTYEKYISDIANIKNLNISETEDIVNQETSEGNIKIVPYSYQLKYARVTKAYNFYKGNVSSGSSPTDIVCGVYASYYVDSSNWQLRYWNAINSTFIEPGYHLQNLQIYSNYATIISNLRIDQHVSFRVSLDTPYASSRTWTKDHSFYL